MGVSTRLVMLAVFAASSGCVLPGKFTVGSAEPAAPAVCQVLSTWNNKVHFVPDPAHGGQPAPGIAGRVYLFGQTIDYPMLAEGSLVFNLYDDTPKDGKASSVQLEEWRFDPTSVKQLAKKDTIGMGYTVFLPWGSYRPDVKNVHVTVRFEPPTGNPLYAPTGPLTLDHTPTP